MKSEIDDMDAQHIVAINQQEVAINNTLTEIKQVILDLQSLLDSNDFFPVFKYTSRSQPTQFQMTLPTFILQEINREKIQQQIGYLSKIVMTYPAIPPLSDDQDITEEHGTPMKISEAVSTPPATPFIDDQDITTKQHGVPMKTPGAMASPPARPLIDEPHIITDINTEYGKHSLCSLSCLSDNELWTCGFWNILRLYNLQGE